MASDTGPELTRSDARRRAILDVASEVFLAQGYAAASMSEIAAKLGGSKGTLYNYFKSKEELFGAFMVATCQEHAAPIFEVLPPIGEGRSVRASLIELGTSLMTFLQLEQVVAAHRLVLAEAGRFPEIGRMYYETGPRRGEQRFTDFMQAAMDSGHLPPASPQEAGQRLKDLVMSDVYMRNLWGVTGGLNGAALEAHVERSVDVFLRAYGPVVD